MAENLKITHYNNPAGPVQETEILYPSDEDWGSDDEGQYGVYDNDPSNADIYGNLYNWAVVNDDRGVCPDGFHMPSDEEWTDLITYLDVDADPDAVDSEHSYIAGGMLKDTGTIEDGDGSSYGTSTIDILYNSTSDIGGFQFFIEGVTLIDASGGAAASGFLLSRSADNGMVLGFSLTGSTIPAGSGTLVVLEVEGSADDVCLTDVVLSDPSGNPLENEVVEGAL